FSVRTEKMCHPVEAYAIRVEHAGRSLTYSGDTGPSEHLDELATGTDLFLCEAAFTHGKENIPDLHLNGREAGESARRADAGRLLLTHIPPWTDPQVNLADARAVYEGPTALAAPGATYEV
ncbi:MBL fold metallo-hydrolase, partial [Streptomyces atriruber]|uniref:MBL fold metallo-hydrolase n=1 Tax=Streptomyces atriruber TaxID=545121 RepID=UPI000A4AB10F